MFVIRVGIVALACCGVFPCACAWAASGENAYVTVSCATAGTEDVVPKGADFYVTTRGVDAANFCADIEVKAHSPYYLVSLEDGRLRCRIGGGGGYEVRDESGTEDSFSGAVEVLKLDIEPEETNICWKSTSCTLKLTRDSHPGGAAVWSSSPAGISGQGNSVTFNPSALSPGVYTVTARSGAVEDYKDTCIVRIIKIVTETSSPIPSNRTRSRIGIGEEVFCQVIPSIPAIWSVDFGGTVFPSVGDRVTFAAHKSPGRAVVSAEIDGLKCTHSFEIVAPCAMQISEVTNDGFKSCVFGARFSGARSKFTFVVLPNDVSFYNVEFRENVPGEDFQWPNGSRGSVSSKIVGWSVDYSNISSDFVSSGLVPCNRLCPEEGAPAQNFTFSVRVPEEYKDENDNWVVWLGTENHPREYRGIDGMCRVGIEVLNLLWGAWMGPWDWK